MLEKRAAMEKWDAFVRSLLAKKYDVRDVA